MEKRTLKSLTNTSAKVATIPAKALLEHIEKLRNLSSSNCTGLIAAGYGQMRGSDLRAMEASGCDHPDLLWDYVEISNLLSTAYCEQDSRRKYHGTDRPIKTAGVLR